MRKESLMASTYTSSISLNEGEDDSFDMSDQLEDGTVLGSVELEADDFTETINVGVLDISGRVYNLRVRKDFPISSIKERLEELSKVEVSRQRLIFRGRFLNDDDTFDSVKITDGSVMHLFKRLKAAECSSVVYCGNRNHADVSHNHRQARAESFSAVPDGYNRLGDLNLSYHSIQEMRLLSFCILIVSILQLLDIVVEYVNTKVLHDSLYPSGLLCLSTGPFMLDFVHSCIGTIVGAIGYRTTFGPSIITIRIYQIGLLLTSTLSVGVRAIMLRDFILESDNCGCPAGANASNSMDQPEHSSLVFPSIGLEKCDKSQETIENHQMLLFVMICQLIIPALIWTWCLFRAHHYSEDIIQSTREPASSSDEGQRLNAPHESNRQNYNTVMAV